MKKYALCLFLVTVFGFSQSAAGYWKGEIELPSMELEIMVSLTDENGWSGTIDIPIQGLRDYALSAIEVTAPNISFEMGGIPGKPRFQGELNAAGDTITGRFSQNNQSMPFKLVRSEKEADEVAFDLTPQTGTSLTGTWRGILKAGPSQLRLELLVETQTDHAAKGIMKSLDQKADFDAELKQTDATITIAMPQIQAGFEGQRNADFSEIKGTWRQAGMDIPITFIRVQ